MWTLDPEQTEKFSGSALSWAGGLEWTWGVTGGLEARGAEGNPKAAEAQVVETVVETEVGSGGGPGPAVRKMSRARAVFLHQPVKRKAAPGSNSGSVCCG